MINKMQSELAELGMTEEDLAAKREKLKTILGKGEIVESPAPIVPVKSDGVKFLPLIPVDKIQVIFSGNGLARVTEEIRRLAMADPAASDQAELMKTAKGRKEIVHLARMVVSSRVYLDDLGKETVANLKALPKLIDANRATMREELDALAASIRKPVTEDEARIAAHEARIQAVREIPLAVQAGTSADVQAQIESVLGMPMTITEWEEFLPEAKATQEQVLNVLSEAYVAKKKAEDDSAELERLRKERTERDRKDAEDRRVREAADRARREAEEKAERERQAALGREAEANRAAELAKQRAAQAEAETAKLKADSLYREIKEYVSKELIELGATQLQRRFNISYGQSVGFMEQMEADGVIGTVQESGKRAVIRATEEQPHPVETPEPTKTLAETREEIGRTLQPVNVPSAQPTPEHRKAFNREALEDIQNAIESVEVTGDLCATAKAIATAIIKGKIRHVSIAY